MNSSLEAVQDRSNDIHSDATARNLCYFRSGAEPRFKNKIESFLISEALGLFGFQDSLFDSTGAQLNGIHAAAVVANLDHDLSALVISVEIDGATRRLSHSEALVGRLDAVINGVADEMHQRFGKGVENALVKIGVLTGQLESHVLATLLGDVADDARETAVKLLDGDHADFQNALVQLIQNAGLKCHGVGKLGAQGIAGMLLIKFGERAIEHRLSDDQFADKIHDGIDTGGVDAERAFGDGGYSRTGSAGTDCRAAFVGIGGPSG